MNNILDYSNIFFLVIYIKAFYFKEYLEFYEIRNKLIFKNILKQKWNLMISLVYLGERILKKYFINKNG